jgi:His-Xaa-Ser system protein HxsD
MAKGVATGADGATEILISLKLYSIEAIKKTAYLFTNRFGVFLDHHDSDHAKVVFNPDKDSKSLDFDSIYNEFCNELLDQDLREIIFNKTEGRRNLILAQAFSRTSLLSDDSGSPTISSEGV